MPKNNIGKQLVRTNLHNMSLDKYLYFCIMANEALKNFLPFKSVLTDNLLPATKTTLEYFNSLALVHAHQY